MIFREDLIEKARESGRDLMRAIEPGHYVRINGDGSFSIGFPTARNMFLKRSVLPRIEGITVGIDVREWTRRTSFGQLAIAGVLNACVATAVELLRKVAVLDPGEPIVTVPTGDGAYLVFDDGKGIKKEGGEAIDTEGFPEAVIGKTLSFVLTLNTLISEYNMRGRFEEDQPPVGGSRGQSFSILPIYVRFALTLDELLLCIDLNNGLGVVGPGVVSCTRILQTDQGNHMLLHDRLLHECDKYGGLTRITSTTSAGDWHPKFHVAELPEVQVKAGKFRYADVFGNYTDEPLLRLRGAASVKPAEYHIGSHDVVRLRGSS